MSDAAVSTPSAPSGGGAPAASAPTSAPQSTSTPSTAQTAASPAANGPPATGAPPAGSTEAQKAEWRRKVKLHGKEVEVSDREIPAWMREHFGEEEAVSLYRVKTAGMTALKEAAELRKQNEAALSRLKGEQLIDALVEINGGDLSVVDNLIAKHYEKRVREAEMTPQERERAKLQRELEQMRAEKQRHDEERRNAERARQRDEYAQRWQTEFPEAAKAARLPWTKATAARMVAHAREALAANEPIDVGSIARDVAAELREEWHALHGESDDDSLLELIGEERMKRIRARDVERLKASQAPVAPPAAPPAPRRENGQFAPQKDAPPMRTRDFFQKRRGL